MVSGFDFISLDPVESMLPRTYADSPAPSLFIHRVKLYQTLLKVLDQLWDKPQRPNDPAVDLRVSTMLDTRISQRVSVISASICDESFVRIADSDDLLHEFMSANRAFSWKISLDVLTLLSARTGGLIGRVNQSRVSGDQQEHKGEK